MPTRRPARHSQGPIAPPRPSEGDAIRPGGNNRRARVPTIAQINAYHKRFGLTGNVIAHSHAVARCAVTMAEAFDTPLDVRLVERAALLHDLDKIVNLHDSKSHGKLTSHFLRERGFPEVARIADVAGIMSWRRLRRWEDKLVGLADKRTLETDCVSLQERLAYIARRYGTGKNAKGREAMRAYRALEREVFAHLPFSPEELPAKVKKHPQVI